MSLTDEGTIEFWIDHEHSDWGTNENVYNFGPFTSDDLQIKATKRSDKNLHIALSIGNDELHVFVGPMPSVSAKGVHVVVTWKVGGEIKLYLNGKPTSSGPFPAPQS